MMPINSKGMRFLTQKLEIKSTEGNLLLNSIGHIIGILKFFINNKFVEDIATETNHSTDLRKLRVGLETVLKLVNVILSYL
jgi:hypothetical protein